MSTPFERYVEFLGTDGRGDRIHQAKELEIVLDKYFKFDSVESIETGASHSKEDGCFGVYLLQYIKSKGGVFHSVDNDRNVVVKSERFYNSLGLDIPIAHYISDSIKFLKEYRGAPNLIHLDSWNLNLANPVPCMLHGWLEFDAIKDKVPVGGIVLIDDNYLKGTWVEWLCYQGGKPTGASERIDVTYDIVGKGAMIYHWVKNYATDWELVGDHYNVASHVKVIVRKVK